MGDVATAIYAYIESVAGYLYRLLVFVANWLLSVIVYVAQWAVSWVAWLLDVFKKLFRGLKGFFSAVAHLRFLEIWRAIKRAYDRIVRLLVWYQNHVQAPIDRMRRQIMDLYNRIFKPILIAIDRVRVTLRIVALFNRRLSALLDRKLWGLESKLLYPITALLKRVNSLSAYTRALVTARGYLDRVLLVESIRRDAGIVWDTLTNPRGLIIDRGAPIPGLPFTESNEAVKQWLRNGTGPLAGELDELKQAYRDYLLEV